jgi:hypothetical protein
MKHKYEKEIKAWAEGSEIEWYSESTNQWIVCRTVPPFNKKLKLRIKPTPLEPLYLFVYERKTTGFIALSKIKRNDKHYDLICRVKVEDHDLPTTV